MRHHAVGRILVEQVVAVGPGADGVDHRALGEMVVQADAHHRAAVILLGAFDRALVLAVKILDHAEQIGRAHRVLHAEEAGDAFERLAGIVEVGVREVAVPGGVGKGAEVLVPVGARIKRPGRAGRLPGAGELHAPLVLALGGVAHDRRLDGGDGAGLRAVPAKGGVEPRVVVREVLFFLIGAVVHAVLQAELRALKDGRDVVEGVAVQEPDVLLRALHAGVDVAGLEGLKVPVPGKRARARGERADAAGAELAPGARKSDLALAVEERVLLGVRARVVGKARLKDEGNGEIVAHLLAAAQAPAGTGVVARGHLERVVAVLDVRVGKARVEHAVEVNRGGGGGHGSGAERREQRGGKHLVRHFECSSK